jgi:ABC-type Fe3+ transport system substrate-binding protein
MVARSSAKLAAAGLLVCLALIAVGFGPGACTPEQPEGSTAKSSPPATLVIITPHSPLIRELFNVGFSYWHYKKYGTYVDIQWLPMGTVECLDYINRATAEGPAGEPRRMPDLMFGGGITDHALLAERGQARPVSLPKLASEIPATVQGLPTRDPEGRWQATALSGFGIIYHKKACAEREIPAPVTWADLARPEYYGWVSMADPTRSGSNRQCLTLIIQSLGWEKGWATIMRMAANCRALLLHSSDVISDVSAGVSLAGLSVSFSAMQEIETRGADRLAYLNPPGATAITPQRRRAEAMGISRGGAAGLSRHPVSLSRASRDLREVRRQAGPARRPADGKDRIQAGHPGGREAVADHRPSVVGSLRGQPHHAPGMLETDHRRGPAS